MLAPFADPTVAGAKGEYRKEYQDRYDCMVGQPQIDFVDTYSAAYRRQLLLSGLPFYAKILQRDAPVLTVAPALLFVRVWVLSWGFFLGNLRLLLLEHFKTHENYKF